MTSLRFVVIGAGRLGASLGMALRAQGLPLVGFTAQTPMGRSRAEVWLGGAASTDLADLVALDPELYVIAVPDSAVAQVAVRLAELLEDRSPPLVVHTSGATSVQALHACAKAGADTLVFHPLQTFSDPVSGCGRFAGTAVAVTPGSADPDSRGAAVGFALARLLGARPFLLADDKRALYHAAATLACNYLVALEHKACELFVRSGLPADEALSLFMPLVAATLANIQTQGTLKALTGPLSRGDFQTVCGHLDALAEESPELLPLYQTLGLATLDLVKARQEIAASTIDELSVLLGSPQDHIHGPHNGADTTQ